LTPAAAELNRQLRALFSTLLLLVIAASSAQAPDTLVLNYHVHSPFASTENGRAQGIEVDIMNEYILFLKAKKKLNITFRYREFSDFNAFFQATKKGGPQTIGLGAMTVNADRAREIDFTTAYLKHVAFCVTNGNAPDVKHKTSDEIMRSLGSMSALTLQNSSLDKYVNELKKSYLQDLKISYQSDQVKILDEIARNVLYFGYVDAIGFWFYLKNNPNKFLKMQKILSQAKEEMAYIVPKGSPHKALFEEFFSGPGGFKTSPTYRAILEKHLGSYMTQNVAVN
jgi:ABC-type amino acid transport substrate-binding protein